MKKMTRTEAIRYLKCSGFSDEQIKAIDEGLRNGEEEEEDESDVVCNFYGYLSNYFYCGS